MCGRYTLHSSPERIARHFEVDPGEYGLWLDRRVTERDRLESLLGPLEDGRLEFYRVSRRVNRPENDDPACIEPAEGAGG